MSSAMDQGVNRERYMLVPRTLIFLTRSDRVLLLKGSAHKRLWPGLYNGVGGHIEQGEDVITAAYRELLEETGITPSKLWLCGTLTVDTQTNPGVCAFIFRGECEDATLKTSPEGNLEWVQRSSINQLPLVSDLPVLLEKVLEMKTGDLPFSANSHYDQTGKPIITFR
jgi:8-oxo-dGTP diphosphatase